jgi:hypothetical protein
MNIRVEFLEFKIVDLFHKTKSTPLFEEKDETIRGAQPLYLQLTLEKVRKL